MAKTGSRNKLPAPEELLLGSHLYEEFDASEDDGELRALSEVVLFEGYIDAYCVDCGQASVFQFGSPAPSPRSDSYFRNIHQESVTNNQFFLLTGCCSRNRLHKALFCFLFKNSSVTKIGQYPSVADLYAPDVKKYRKVMSEENFADLKRALGLRANGIGAGSFIYLRRIFENLIEEAHRTAVADGEWSEEIYSRARMEDKIRILAPHLPSALVEFGMIYGILSKGVHSLTEDECLKYFEPVRKSIELILEEKIIELQEMEKQRIARETKSILSQIKSTLC
jgi:hypothetical protein